MATTLEYADRQPRRGAPWWLWALTALTVLFGFFWFCVLIAVRGKSEATLRAAARADVLNLRTALDALARTRGGTRRSWKGWGRWPVRRSG